MSLAHVSFTSHDVNGVKVVVCEHDTEKSTDVRAILSLRVGESDEAIPYRGVTSIALRMALDGCNWTVDVKWAVEFAMSSIEFVGEEDHVLGALHHVCSRLGSLPWDSLEDARSAELDQTIDREMNTPQRTLASLYDYMGYGLNGLPSTGAFQLTPDMLSYWAATFLSRGNVALTLSNEVADKDALISALDLLPQGEYRPPIDARLTRQLVLPRHVVSSDYMVFFIGLVARDAAGLVASDIVSGRLLDVLRTQLGLAYSPFMGTHTLDGITDLVVAGAELAPETTLDGTRLFLRTIERSCNDITADEVQSSIGKVATKMSTVDSHHPLVAAAAERAILKRPVRSLSESLEAVQSVSQTDVLEFLTAAWETRVTASPSRGTNTDYACYSRTYNNDSVPPGSTAVITDWHQKFKMFFEIHDIGIVVANEELSEHMLIGEFSDLRWALTYDQRVVELGFSRAITVTIDTREFSNGEAWWAELLRRIPEYRLAHQGRYMG